MVNCDQQNYGFGFPVVLIINLKSYKGADLHTNSQQRPHSDLNITNYLHSVTL